MAAATRSLFCSSLVARGNSAFFVKSFLAMMAVILPSLVTIGSFPFLLSFNVAFAATSSTPSPAVIRSLAGVMTCSTVTELRLGTKSVSRFVTSPSKVEPIAPSSVTGKPVKPHCALSMSRSDKSMSGLIHTGSTMKPLLYFLTFVTSLTWSSMDRLVWMMPNPPWSAIAMAILDSVTVSIGLETTGVRRVIVFEKRDVSCTS
mmetsp:Transcript_4483/g.9721  ORF Transcript_4483/g.9721 Transcript_4483/m.9721 type:complete len:203 (+) Transcript_4483:173-781(+)